MAKQKRGPSPRHNFHTTEPRYPGGPAIHRKFPCKVKDGTAKIKLPLILEHIKLAQKAKGQGSTSACAMAICAQRLEHLFPHPVFGIDWQYRTLYVIDSLDKNGHPKTCVRYSHYDDIAHINDSPKGLRKLEKLVEEKGGKVEVTALPYQKNTWSDRTPAYLRTRVRPKGRPEYAGERTKDAPHARQKGGMGTGAKLRLTTAYPGLKPPF